MESEASRLSSMRLLSVSVADSGVDTGAESMTGAASAASAVAVATAVPETDTRSTTVMLGLEAGAGSSADSMIHEASSSTSRCSRTDAAPPAPSLPAGFLKAGRSVRSDTHKAAVDTVAERPRTLDQGSLALSLTTSILDSWGIDLSCAAEVMGPLLRR